MESYHEPGRNVPVVDAVDVLVCGGGPAGIAAAVAASRAGARTRLIEVHGCLGGVWTAGALSYVLDCGNKTGIMRELITRLERYWGQPLNRDLSSDLPWVSGSFYFDVEVMKLTLEQLCLEAGVAVQLHTRVVAAGRVAGRQLSVAVTESKSGRQAWRAKVFVDASGDGDLAALAGCGFDYGREGSGETQPMTLMALLTGIRIDAAGTFVTGRVGVGEEAKDNLLGELRRAGVAPSYGRPTLFHVRDGLFALMANHQYAVSALDAAQMTEATFKARAELHQIVKGLRALGDPWRDISVVSTAEQIGVREGRRIHGLYRVTEGDLVQGTMHEDSVCRVTFPVDVHSTNASSGTGYDMAGVQSKPYDIPQRALIAKDVDNLVMAGRCISGDFLAHASYRVTGNAVAMGEAAGLLAARSALADTPPKQVGGISTLNKVNQ